MGTPYDPVECDLEAFRNTYVMGPELWDKFDISDLEVDFSIWGKAKMMNDVGGLNEEVANIPTAFGGIYVYIIVPPVIPEVGAYIMYVGMATKTPHENLQARVRSYKREFKDNSKRRRLHRLFDKWGKYVYVAYLPVDSSNEVIETLEDRLIAALVPPCNADIQIKSVKDAVRAFA